MKILTILTLLMSFMLVSSCAHYGKKDCCKDNKSCEIKKGDKSCCGEKKVERKCTNEKCKKEKCDGKSCEL